MGEQLTWTALGIDQSINHTGLCLLVAGKPVVLESIDLEKLDGFARQATIVDRIEAIVDEHRPTIIVMEDYARQAHSSSIIPLVELGGCIKMAAHRRGYGFTREDRLHAERVFMVQNQSQMKKFVLGDGSISKDEAYLLKILNKINLQFQDSNQADAYMHAWMSVLVLAVMRGYVTIDSLPSYQQEALISGGAKRRKGLSLSKAMKLPVEEKIKLAGF